MAAKSNEWICCSGLADPAINVQTKATVPARRRDEKGNMEPIIEGAPRRWTDGVWLAMMKGEAGKMKQEMTNRRRVASVLLVVLLALTGCDGFFVPEHGGGGGGTTGNYVYIANANTNTVAGFSIASGKLTAISGSPVAVGYSPVALTVTPSDSFLYVAGPGAIYVYTINSDGSLTAPSASLRKLGNCATSR